LALNDDPEAKTYSRRSSSRASRRQGLGAFVAATHGVIGLTESGALDYADCGIRINAIAAGSIMTDRIGALPDEQRAPIAQAIPMHRIGLPEDMAATAA
jgi:NAD(P)-dependent dehydrogenase (short-subunit alcohol dehydrogenase family)